MWDSIGVDCEGLRLKVLGERGTFDRETERTIDGESASIERVWKKILIRRVILASWWGLEK